MELAHLSDQLENLKQVIVERIVPSFVSVRNDAQAVFEVMDEKFTRESSSADLDPQEEAVIAANEYLALTQSSQQAILDGMAIVLYHLFETSMRAIGRNYLPADRHSSETPSLPLVMDGLASMSVSCGQFTSWRSIQQLQLVANAVKHGEVDTRLRQWRPDLFSKRWSDEHLQLMAEKFGPECLALLDTPLERRRLVVSQDALSSFCDSLKAFYDELARELTIHTTEH